MGVHQSLEELKAENAAEEAEVAEETVIPATEVEPEAGKVETPESGEVAEPDPKEGEEAKLEPWQLEEDGEQAAGSDHVLTDHDAARIRRKYQAREEKKDDELAQMRAEIEALKRPATAPTPSSQPAAGNPMPKLEDFEYDEARFNAGTQSWLDNEFDRRVSRSSQQGQRTAQLQQSERERNSSVNDHYVRVDTLAKEKGITPEVFQTSDRVLRHAVDSVFKGRGDAIIDDLIANIGAGSEKVIHSLGVNETNRAALISKLIQDPRGVAASIYLGELKAKVSAPTKLSSNAPRPAATANGDAAGVVSGDAKKALESYKKAHKDGNPQAAFNTRQEARKAGLDVSNW